MLLKNYPLSLRYFTFICKSRIYFLNFDKVGDINFRNILSFLLILGDSSLNPTLSKLRNLESVSVIVGLLFF